MNSGSSTQVPAASAGSPASRGPAGTHFEGQVGASYLLSLITGSDGRGLPGCAVERVKLQAAAEGHALDDVVVYARDRQGAVATLEIQVKRTITFARSDEEFRDVVRQMVETAGKSEFATNRYELAVATARHTAKIDGPYQEVLAWARQVNDAATFMARIRRKKCASDDMRAFVETFRTHLQTHGATHDDENVWRLLRRFQIHVYDFAAKGSSDEHHVIGAVRATLHADEAPRAGVFWSWLVERAIAIASRAGDRTRATFQEELKETSFQFSGDRRYQSARNALAEASEFAMAQVFDQVGGVRLARHTHLNSLREALDQGRYVEIRGEPGVGKSGIMKRLALEVADQSQIIFLTPERTTGGGWAAMRSVIGFDGLASELLSDLALRGGAFLFVDNLDLYPAAARATVVDLIRVAAELPGFRVIATARTNFGVEEHNWLPAEALENLGPKQSLLVGDLTEDEVEELSEAAPSLGPLLADGHPARAMSRNLFRLGQLAMDPAQPSVNTEVDLALWWWRGGASDMPSRRDRTRALKALAQQTIGTGTVLNASAISSGAVDDLIAGGALTDLQDDRVSFRHDVQREWAIGCLIGTDPSEIERLALSDAAGVSHARGIEIAARMAIERNDTHTAWSELLARTSNPDVHPSWRRAVLLALVRSEQALQALTRAALPLLENGGVVLRELLRLVMAVEVERATTLYARPEVDPKVISETLMLPNGPAWYRLVQWLLILDKHLPRAAIPEVAELYSEWSMRLLGEDPCTPAILPWVFEWITEIERGREDRWAPDAPEAFDGEVKPEALKALESSLRTTLVLFAKRAPEVGKQYLKRLPQQKHAEEAIRSILRLSGSLPQAAPQELADLVRAWLTSADEEEAGGRQERVFSTNDLHFLPASPAQGPFFELLKHAPKIALKLIRDLVDHAISKLSRGRQLSPHDAFVLDLGGGQSARYPWRRSYRFARDESYAAMASALMALEAWGHSRIEAGEEVVTVLAEVCPTGAPAAYLLFAVDLIVSHWPKSVRAAVPYLACPELLVADRERQSLDSFDVPDFFGIKALHQEPRGAVSLESLRMRRSRKYPLESLIDLTAHEGDESLRQELGARLRDAASRLGAPNPRDNLASPALMARHALNRLDTANWAERSIERDGRHITYWEYIPPEEERRHLAPLVADFESKRVDTEMQASIVAALDRPGSSAQDLAAGAAAWAQQTTVTDDDTLRQHAVTIAAMIAMRDGEPAVRTSNAAWAKDTFMKALGEEADAVHRVRKGVRFNRPAIAFIGLARGYLNGVPGFELIDLLRAASDSNPASGWGYGAVAEDLHNRNDRLSRALLRCAIAARVRPERHWPDDPEASSRREERYSQRIDAAVSAEIAWLEGRAGEPRWPSVPLEQRLRAGSRIRLGGSGASAVKHAPRAKPQEYFDHQGAAIWIGQLAPVSAFAMAPWTIELLRTYSNWTAHANGRGADSNANVDDPHDWNECYFDLLARCVGQLSVGDVDALCIHPVVELPDEPFMDVISAFARSIDVAYFNQTAITPEIASKLRQAFATRLSKTWGWRRLRASTSDSIEIHLGPAVGVLFFNDWMMGQPPKCYLPPAAVPRARLSVPILRELAAGAPSFFVAAAFLNFCEVLPEAVSRGVLVETGCAWLDAYPADRRFWVDAGIGRRICALIPRSGNASQESAELGRLDRLISALIGLGVAEASHLGKVLAKNSN